MKDTGSPWGLRGMRVRCRFFRFHPPRSIDTTLSTVHATCDASIAIGRIQGLGSNRQTCTAPLRARTAPATRWSSYYT